VYVHTYVKPAFVDVYWLVGWYVTLAQLSDERSEKLNRDQQSSAVADQRKKETTSGPIVEPLALKLSDDDEDEDANSFDEPERNELVLAKPGTAGESDQTTAQSAVLPVEASCTTPEPVQVRSQSEDERRAAEEPVVMTSQPRAGELDSEGRSVTHYRRKSECPSSLSEIDEDDERQEMSPKLADSEIEDNVPYSSETSTDVRRDLGASVLKDADLKLNIDQDPPRIEHTTLAKPCENVWEGGDILRESQTDHRNELQEVMKLENDAATTEQADENSSSASVISEAALGAGEGDVQTILTTKRSSPQLSKMYDDEQSDPDSDFDTDDGDGISNMNVSTNKLVAENVKETSQPPVSIFDQSYRLSNEHTLMSRVESSVRTMESRDIGGKVSVTSVQADDSSSRVSSMVAVATNVVTSSTKKEVISLSKVVSTSDSTRLSALEITAENQVHHLHTSNAEDVEVSRNVAVMNQKSTSDESHLTIQVPIEHFWATVDVFTVGLVKRFLETNLCHLDESAGVLELIFKNTCPTETRPVIRIIFVNCNNR
jgi:hypothetical protein